MFDSSVQYLAALLIVLGMCIGNIGRQKDRLKGSSRQCRIAWLVVIIPNKISIKERIISIPITINGYRDRIFRIPFMGIFSNVLH